MKYLKPFVLILAVSLAVVAAVYWRIHLTDERLPGIASGNGRLEATEIDIATKLQGRIESVLVQEGDLVKEGQVVARIDASVLRAQLREAEAGKRRAEEELNVARALIAQRESEHDLALKVLQRSDQLLRKTAIDQNQFDRDQSAERAARAVWLAAQAGATSAAAAIDSAAAQIERIRADLDDTVLKSPRLGRVQYRLAEPGEVLPAGGKVITLIDITDVYLTFFLPTAEAGQLFYGGDARIVLDVLPDRPIPATVSFVSPSAQFTPKEVETRSEREKLMFRVKVKIDPGLLLQYADRVKTGLPGMAYVKLASDMAWPIRLQTDLPIPTPVPADSP